MNELPPVNGFPGYGVPPLLADISRQLGRSQRPDGSAMNTDDLVWVGALILGAILLLVLLRFAQLARNNFRQRSQRGLFLELCRAHRIGWRQRARLWRLARQLDQESPATVFVRPDKLHDESVSKTRSLAEREEIRRLHQELFRGSFSSQRQG